MEDKCEHGDDRFGMAGRRVCGWKTGVNKRKMAGDHEDEREYREVGRW